MARLVYVMTPEDEGRLLGDVLRKRAGMSRKGLIHAKYRDDGILLDGVRTRTNMPVRAGQVASVVIEDEDDAREGCTVTAQASPEACAAVSILFEDDALAVVNKPAGMVMYPGPSHWEDTLGNVMLAHTVASGKNATLHPVHRLDGGTSGAVVFAYNAHVQHTLQKGLHTGAFRREYVAFCEGVPGVADTENPALTCEDECFTVDAPIARIAYAPSVFAAVSPEDPAGKNARTHFWVERSFWVETPEGSHEVSQLRLQLETGRTHQIRIHMALIGHPLLGDDAYGNGVFTYRGAATNEWQTLARPALHSAKVQLTHPLTGEAVAIEAPLPEDLAALAGADVAHMNDRQQPAMTLEEYAALMQTMQDMEGYISRGHLDLTDILMLRYLEQKEQARPKTMQADLGISKSQISRRIARMVDMGLISEQVDPNNFRQTLLSVTRKSRNINYEITRAFPVQGEWVFRLYATAYRASADASTAHRMPGLSIAATKVLGALACTAQALSIGEVASVCALTRSTASDAVTSLVKHGLAKKSTGHSLPGEGRDNRFIYAELTDSGKQAAEFLLTLLYDSCPVSANFK